MANRSTELCIAFRTTIPDDTEWDENDELRKPGGRAILHYIGEYLRSKGYTTSQLTQYSHFGWEVDAKKQKASVRLLVQFIDPWLIVAKGVGSIFRRAGKKASIDQLEEDLRGWMERSPVFLDPTSGSRRDLINEGYKIKES